VDLAIDHERVLLGAVGRRTRLVRRLSAKRRMVLSAKMKKR